MGWDDVTAEYKKAPSKSTSKKTKSKKSGLGSSGAGGWGAVTSQYAKAETETGGAAGKAATVEKLKDQAEDEGILGSIQGALSAPMNLVTEALNILDLPRAAIASGLKETADLLQGGAESSDSDEHHTASLGDLWNQIGSHYGFGEFLHDENVRTGNEWGDRALGFVGDVGLDPLTYLSFGTTAVAKGVGGKALVEGAEAAGKAVAREGAEEGVTKISRALLSREDVARRLEGLVDNGLDRAAVDELQDTVFKRGAAGLPRDVQREIGVRSGASFGVGKRARVMVPGSERAAELMGRAGGAVRGGGSWGLRKTPGLRKLPTLLESVPGAAKIAEELGPRTAWAYKTSWREATDQAGRLGNDLGRGLIELEKRFGDVDPDELRQVIEAPGYSKSHLAAGEAGLELQSWFETVRSQVEELTGVPVARYEDYLPHRMTEEFRQALEDGGKSAQRTPKGGGAPFRKMRSYRPGSKFLGVELQQGTIDELEGIARQVFGDDYRQMFKDNPWELAHTYLNEITKVGQRGAFENNLLKRGLAVDAKLGSIRKRFKQQASLRDAAFATGKKAHRQTRQASALHALADELEESAGRGLGSRQMALKDAGLVQAAQVSTAASGAVAGRAIGPAVQRVQAAQKQVVAALRNLPGEATDDGIQAAQAALEAARNDLATLTRNVPSGSAVDIAPFQQELALANSTIEKVKQILDVDDAVQADLASGGVPYRAPTIDVSEGTARGVAFYDDLDRRAQPFEDAVDVLNDEMGDARALWGEEFTPKTVKDLKLQAREYAADYADTMRGRLEQADATRLPKPPERRQVQDALRGTHWSRGVAGEWDWFDGLGRTEQARLQRNWLTRDGGNYAPDQIAQAWNLANGTDLGVDEVMSEWLSLTRQIDATESFARTGKLPNPDAIGGIDVDDLIDPLAERGIKVSELYGADPVGHLEAARDDYGFARGVRRPEEIEAELVPLREQLDAFSSQADGFEQELETLTHGQGVERPLGVPELDDALANVDWSSVRNTRGLKRLGQDPLTNQTRSYLERASMKLDERGAQLTKILDDIEAGRAVAVPDGMSVAELRKQSTTIRGLIHPIYTATEDELQGVVKKLVKDVEIADLHIDDLTQRLERVRAELQLQGSVAKDLKRADIDVAATRTELRKVTQRLKETRVPKSVEELTARKTELEGAIAAADNAAAGIAPKDVEHLTAQLDGLSSQLDRALAMRDGDMRRIRDADAALAARRTVEARGGAMTPETVAKIEAQTQRVSTAANKVIEEDELFNAANAARRDGDELLVANERQLQVEELALETARGERADRLKDSVELRTEAHRLFQEAEQAVDIPLQESIRVRAQAMVAEAKAGKHTVESERLWRKAATTVSDDELGKMRQILESNMQEFADGRWADPDIADAVKATFDLMQPTELRKSLKVYDQLLTRWKAYSLLSPGFHLRNFMGAMFNNSLAGIDPSMYITYERAAMQYAKGGVEAISNVEVREAYREGLLHEIVSGSDQVRDFGDLVNMPGVQAGSNDGVAQRILKTDGTLANKLDPTSLDFAPLALNQKAGGFVERHVRMPLFIDSVVNKGMSVEEGLERVRKFHFDYQHGLSKFERNVAKRVMPFYTWTRFNFPLQIEMMMRRPGRYTAYLSAKRNIELGLEDEDVVPAYYSTLLAIHTPFKGRSGMGALLGGGGGETGDIYLTPDLPFRDLSETFNVNSLIGSLSPAIKVPLELAAGKQFFSDIPFKTGAAGLTEMPKAYLPILPLLLAASATEKLHLGSFGLPKVTVQDGKFFMQEKDAYKIDSSLPLLGRLRRMVPSEQRFQDRATTTYMSVLGGVSSVTNTDSQKYGELLRQERIIKDALKRRGILTGEAA